MSKTVIAIDPVTRLEGHLKVEVQVEDGKVADAWITGGMFRGFEAILRGRNPRDASQIVQRICGVCPVAHATASSLAIEAVCGVEVPENGRIARNLMLAGNYLQSNILHFYHLGGQDYFHGPDTVPFIPRYRNPDLRLSEEQNTLAMDEYIEALETKGNTDLTAVTEAMKEFQRTSQNAFNEWFATVQGLLDEDVAGRLINKTSDLDERLTALEYMIIHNDLFTHVVDDDGNPILDDDGNAIIGDWKYKTA